MIKTEEAKGLRFERTPVLTTAVAAPAPSEAQLRIRDSAPNAMILQGEQPGRGEEGVDTETKRMERSR